MKCALCVLDLDPIDPLKNARDAVTQLAGTLLCRECITEASEGPGFAATPMVRQVKMARRSVRPDG